MAATVGRFWRAVSKTRGLCTATGINTKLSGDELRLTCSEKGNDRAILCLLCGKYNMLDILFS